MRQHITVVLVIAGLLAAIAVLLGPSWFGTSEPLFKWHERDEVDAGQPPAEADLAEAGALGNERETAGTTSLGALLRAKLDTQKE